MFEKFVARFVNDLIKTINTPYSIYNRLLNFEFNCFDIGFIGFMNFFSFYRAESLTIAAAIMFGAEVIRSVLKNKSIVYTTGSGEKRGERRRSVNLFVVTVVVGLDDIYLIRFLILLLFIFILRFIVITFFSIVAIFVFFVAVLFVRTMFRRIYIASFESLKL